MTCARLHRPLSLAIIAATLWLAGAPADAATKIVYFHGRSMTTWPWQATMFASTSLFEHHALSYNGSLRLGHPATRTAIRDQLRAKCTTADCVVVCYSAGCARALIAFNDLAAEGTPARVLWTEALASAAGGSELAQYSTNNGLRLLAKLFLTNPGPPAEPVDHDLPPVNMRITSWAHIQGASPSPMYHLAGSRDICIKTKIRGLGFLASSVAQYALNAAQVAGPVGFVISTVVGHIFGSAKVRLCGNKYLPGGHGDGVVPVHSAAGYADGGAHASHHDGAAKYPFRAYEQVPLFDRDHVGIFRPGIELGSLRLAVSSATATACIDAANAAAASGESEASIVYEDGDAAHGNTSTEVAPIALLQICGNDMFAGSTETPLYATCHGQGGCCDNFSTGATAGCTCGETLCVHAGREYKSWFTELNCAGLEYTYGPNASLTPNTWDGQGMVGAAATTVNVRSVRDVDGRCKNTTKAVRYNSCTLYSLKTWAMAGARRVYRPGISSYLPNIQLVNSDPGHVVEAETHLNWFCPG